MARTAFEEPQGFLKAHPNAGPVAYRRRRGPQQPGLQDRRDQTIAYALQKLVAGLTR